MVLGTILAVFAAAGAMAATPQAPEGTGKEDTARSALVHEVVVAGSLNEVWAAFTTKQGIESWMVPKAEIDFRIGGKLRTSYNKESTLKDDSAIEHTILSYDPKKMFSFRTTKTPKGFPFVKTMEGVWNVVYFESLGPKSTKVTLRMLGYGTDEEARKMREFFDKGNAWTMEQLQKKFAKP